MTDHLERLLSETGRAIEWPDEPDLVPRVSRAIAAQPRRAPWLPRLAFATAAVIVGVTGLMIFSPATRDAVADFLGIGNVRVTFGPLPDEEIGTRFQLGERVATLEAAEGAAGFDLRVPTDEDLGDPDQIWVATDAPGGPLVGLVYGPRPILYATEDGVGALFTQSPVGLAGDEFYFKKLAPGGTTVTKVRVGSVEGYWFEGEPHAFYVEDENGELIEESVRLVGNVLVWEQDGFTFRLEVGDMRISAALRLAASVR